MTERLLPLIRITFVGSLLSIIQYEDVAVVDLRRVV